MANKFDGDVRPLSNDPRYMGVVFSGKMANAIKQAKAAPSYGRPRLSSSARLYKVQKRISRERLALLQHLNLAPL
jgi:hypothetical protein